MYDDTIIWINRYLDFMCSIEECNIYSVLCCGKMESLITFIIILFL